MGILKNNQERGNEAETSLIQNVLPEAMLIACVNTTDASQNPANPKPYLLVCEIPADKNRSGATTKLPKSEENKGKSKSVCYSTQLSFESEDEYYDPLFSVPSVFQSIASPLKDAFAKSPAEKTDEKVVLKDAKIVQCVSMEKIGRDGVEVAQVIPYEDGSHVLFVVTKRRQVFDHEACRNSHCPGEYGVSTNVGTLMDNLDNKDNNGCDVICDSVKTDFIAEETNTRDNTNSPANDQPNTAVVHDECSGLDFNAPADVPTRTSECVTEDKSQGNMKHPKETTDYSTNLSAGADIDSGALSTAELPKCTSRNIKYSEKPVSPSVDTNPAVVSELQSRNEPISSQASSTKTTNQNNSLSEDIVSGPDTESKVPLGESTISSTSSERNYSVWLLLYKTRKEKGRTLLEDKPCRTLLTNSSHDSLSDVFLLPEDAEDSFMPSSVEVNKANYVYVAGRVFVYITRLVYTIKLSGLSPHVGEHYWHITLLSILTFPGVTADGSLAVIDGLTLETVSTFSPADKIVGRINRAIFCSGLGSFCVCTEDGKLHFLHLVKKHELTEQLVSAGASQAGSAEQPKGKHVSC